MGMLCCILLCVREEYKLLHMIGAKRVEARLDSAFTKPEAWVKSLVSDLQ